MINRVGQSWLNQNWCNFMFNYNKRKSPVNKIYYPDLMKVGERKIYCSNIRDSMKMALWRVTKNLGYKYKVKIDGREMLVERVL